MHQKNRSLLAAWAILSSCSCLALPTDPTIVGGTAEIHANESNHLQIHTSNKAIINWQDFSIGAHEHVQFIQPATTSAVLNRVQGGAASQILGQLHANGKVYLINPSGVIFGQDAIIKTADFLASTHDLSNEQFLQGTQCLFNGDSKEAIINYGHITAIDGHVTLLGKFVENQGSIYAPQGTVHIAAAQEILLKLEDTPLLTIRPSLTPDSQLTQAGQIEALIIDLQSEGHAASHGINLQGSVLALHTVEQKGRIYLKSDGIAIAPSGTLEATDGTIELVTTGKGLYLEGKVIARQGDISIDSTAADVPFFHLGTLDVSGPSAGHISIDTTHFINSGQIVANGQEGNGGHIDIHAHNSYVEMGKSLVSTDGLQKGGEISLQADISFFSSGTLSSQALRGGEISILSPTLTLVSAEVNASGTTDGGQIFIGGGPHGEIRNAPNALITRIGGNGHISASAKESGDGGTIVVWSDEKTICYGTMEANGGANKGNGGWIEVSSHQDLCCAATLSANAPQGTAGTLLLDPKNITISSTGAYPQYEFIDPSPANGSGFGTDVLALNSGNIVITKPQYNTDVGAVYLYDGLTGELISTLTGSMAGDQVGVGGVRLLIGNNNYVINSYQWNNSSGAATWCNGVDGVNGMVSSANSLVGGIASSNVGSGGITALMINGNYVVCSPNWVDGATNGEGATTWGNGATGITGLVSQANSIIGKEPSDFVGSGGVIALTNGNYVVLSPDIDNDDAGGGVAGAVTWADGTIPTAFTVDTTNSLFGPNSDDQVGSGGGIALANGHCVVSSPFWNGGTGAVTWINGSTAGPRTVGEVSITNSLIGSLTTDSVGSGGIVALPQNNNYVAQSPAWSNNMGASTWGDGDGGTVGVITSGNSLVGVTTGDLIGSSAVSLANGNYVVISPSFINQGQANCGAVTWGDGAGGTTTGQVSSLNSFVGDVAEDRVGSNGITELTVNHNYVIQSPTWHTNMGAATWASGTSASFGTVGAGNSFVGSTATPDSAFGDQIGISVIALTNGNFVTYSQHWSDAGVLELGSATWGNGETGEFSGGGTGPVSSSNSLVGTIQGSHVGITAIPLTTGHFVIGSPDWTTFEGQTLGAATWGDGTTGQSSTGFGGVSSLNSFVGSLFNDNVGQQLVALPNGNYVVLSPNWKRPTNFTAAGAATLGNGDTGEFVVGMSAHGPVAPENSLVGARSNDNIGSGGAVPLSNNDYVVISPNFRNGVLNAAGAATLGNGATGTVGIVTMQNSVVGTTASSGLDQGGNFPPVEDTVNGTFLSRFITGGTSASGRVVAGIENPNQLSFQRAEGLTVNVPPAFLTNTLNTGTAVTLQASNDLTISNAIATTAPAALTLVAGRSVAINANITTTNGALSIVANQGTGVVDSERDAGNALFSIANGVTIDTGTANLTLTLSDGAGNTNTESGDLTIGDNVTLQCQGSGVLNVIATDHNIVLGSDVLATTADGLLQFTAGVDIEATGPATIQTTGTGELILLCDNLFPTSPTFGDGAADISDVTLTTGGGKLLIYTSQRDLNTLPATINGVPYVAGTEFVDSVTEKWGTYYPSSSGIPFTVFYKQTGTPPTPPPGPPGPPGPPPPPGPPSPPSPPTPQPVPPSHLSTDAFYEMITAVVGPFQFWQNPWYNDLYFAADRYPPFLTPKALRIRLPSLVDTEVDGLDWID